MLAHDDTAVPVLAGVRDQDRIAVLERIQEVTGTADPALDRVARLAAGLFTAPAAYVTLVGADEQRSPGAVETDTQGEPMRRLALDDSICQFQVVTDEPLVIRDTRHDPITEHNRTVLDGTIAAYAGMPLRTAAGHVLGSLCVIDRTPRSWDERQLGLLDDLAVIVSTDIEHRLAARRAAETQSAARQLVDAWRPHGDALAGLVELAEQSDDPRLQASAARARATASRVDLAAQTMGETSQQEVRPVRSAAPTDLRRLAERAVQGARHATGTSAISLDLPGAALPVRCDPIAAESGLVSVLVSALHHTPRGNMLAVRLTLDDGAREGVVELASQATQIPTAELARLVARFAQAVDACDERPPNSAALRMMRGGVRAMSGPVCASSTADGLQFRARWTLSPAVIDLT